MPVLAKTQAVLPTNKEISAGEEPRCICIIKDETTTPKKTHSHTLPSSTTIGQLFDEVAKKLHYVEKSFSIVFSQSSSSSESGEDVALDKTEPSRTLSQMGFKDNRGKNYLYVSCADGILPRPSHGPPITEYSSDEGTSTNLPYKPAVPPPPPPPPPPPINGLEVPQGPSNRRNALSDDSSFTFSESIENAASKINHQDSSTITSLVGLVNQAMTCYLNSLIQTLYMTPEFRNTLYEWKFEGTHEEGATNIPYQLQRLFLALQTSRKQAVETTDLTKSFGWDSSEAWQQHDIQELCRVMFDALERSFRETDQKDIIKQLYEGKMKDYVQCEDCKNESAREDTYLDIPITIRPFGSSVAYKNVMEGLKAFVEPEILDGSNQYFCGKCEKKCDAKKGLKFITFPYLLTLQLKRFDFDYTTMHRVKLNDRMYFPEELDLTYFLEQKIKDTLSEPGSDCVEDAAEDGLEMGGELQIDEEEGDYSSRDSGNDDDRPYSGDRSKRLVQHVSDDSEEGSSVDEGIDIESQKSYGNATPATSGTGGSRCEEDGLGSGGSTPGAIGGKKEDWEGLPVACEIVEFGKKKESYVYELFSIMIHSGSAVGGHYYAYIKSFDDGQWYSFNDQIVSPILFEDIKKSYGGTLGRSSYYSSFSSSTNAYMLMYRQIDKARNKGFIRTENLPSHIKAMEQEEKEREKLAKIRREKERNMCSIKVYCNHPSLLQRSSQTVAYEHYEFMNTTTLQEAVEECHKLLKLDKAGIPCERCRLVKYDNYHQSLDESYDDDQAQRPLVELFGCVRSSYLFDLLMETREENEVFEVYKPGGITIKVFSADYSKGCFKDPFTVRLMENDNVHHLKQILAKRLHYPLPRIRLAYEKFTSDVQLVTTNKVLKDLGHYRSIKVYVDAMSEEELDEFCKCYPQGHNKNTSTTRIFVRDTRLWTLIDRAAHIINVSIILPHDSPTYELVPSRPSTPASNRSRCSTPSSLPSLVSIPSSPSAIDHSSKGARVEPYKFNPSSDEGLGPCDESSGDNKDTKGLEFVEKSDASDNITQGDQGAEENTDIAAEEILRFWKSPELANQTASNAGITVRDQEYESPLPSLSLHLRRNSEEKGSVGEFTGYPSLSAGDFQAELDRKFLAAGYNANSPTSSLRCEDGSSNSETASLGEFDIQNDYGQAGNGATDSAGSCSTLDSTDTLCNSQQVDYYETVRTKPVTTASSLDSTLPSNLHSYSDNDYTESVTKDHTKRCALPGMAKLVVKDDEVDYAGAGDNSSEDYGYCDDGRVEKAVSPGEGCDGSAELCRCRSGLVGQDSSEGKGDTGPSYLCSKCGRLKAESTFLVDGGAGKRDENTNTLSECDPDSGEGLDRITPLFEESEEEDKNVIGTGPSSSYLEMSLMGTSSSHSDPGTSRQRTESSSSALSDLGWGDQQLTQPCYFRVCAVSSNSEKCQVLKAQLDKRSTVGWLKRQLHPIIQVPTREFSLYKMQQGSQETELNSLNENFNHYRDDIEVKVKHERALRKNEHRCKIYQLLPGDVEHMKPLMDWVIRKGASIEESHLLLSEELSRQCNLQVKPENIRLRNKCWRNPGRIFLAGEKFGIDIITSSEIFLEVLDKPEQKTNHHQLAVYCRRWRPSTLTLEGFEEVVVDPDEKQNHSVEELKKKLSEISDINPEDVEWAKPRSMFPGHISVLEVHEDLEWEHTFVEYLHESSCNIADDGAVIFYRDKKEALKILSEQERSDLKTKEDSRLAATKVSTSTGSLKNTGLYGRPYSRKEKALKIYTVDSIAKKKEATTSL